MLSDKRKQRLVRQGYGDLSSSELEAVAPWLRLYPSLCAVLIVLATAIASPALMYALAAIALMSTIFKHHPFDLVYNVAVVPALKTPSIPPNRLPRRAACAAATVGLSLAGYLLSSGYVGLGQVVGAILGIAATVKATTDYCPVSHFIYRSSPSAAARTTIF